jgi:hypothetical protein
MGSELIQDAAYFNPGFGQWQSGEPNRPVVGEFIATALDLQGISASQFTTLRVRLEQTKAKLDQFRQNPGDPTPVQTLTKEAISGDLLYSGVLSYFGAIDVMGQLMARRANVETQRMPSFGNFGTAAQVFFFFGVPRTTAFRGVQMDVDRVAGSEVSKDATPGVVAAFRKAAGIQYSALEHSMPERAFRNASLPDNDPGQPQAVSAVKAIAVAASQGQRIYALNAANQAIHTSALSQLNVDAAVKDEIADALATGKEVTVHQSKINFAGFTGSGYIITDPETGAGAYKVSGGANGSFMTLVSGLLGQLAGFASLVSPLVSFVADAARTVLEVIQIFEHCDAPFGAWLAGLVIAFFIGSLLLSAIITILIAGPIGLVVAALASALFGGIMGLVTEGIRRNVCGGRRRPENMRRPGRMKWPNAHAVAPSRIT